jgi:signal transduction histidine kinase
MPQTPPTSFAPAERASKSDLFRQSRLIEDTPLLCQLYDTVSDIILILNRHRQIVFCNKRVADLLGVEDRRRLYGLRPGEALGCHYACGADGGCGTTMFCSACGAVNAILTSQAGDADTRECSIMRSNGQDALELLIKASPLDLNGARFTVLAASDISHEKRRRVLERAFFHDLMNTAMGLKLFTRTLAKAPAGRVPSLADGIRKGIERLLAEIEEQRDLARAENNELAARVGSIQSMPFVQGLVDLYGQYSELQHCPLLVAAEAEDFAFHSDHTLLARVLGNMVKNALEASEEGRPVTVGCWQVYGRVEFRVHNHGVMPPEVQLQVFQRSFTTKGPGRGLGTYSMKLLSERYLGGVVTFTSSQEDGTTFVATYPLELEAE